MDKFLEFVVEYFGAFILMLLGAAFIWFCFALAEESNRKRELTKQRTEYCYSQGMVLVSTDAGQRCVDPKSLVKVK